MGDAARARATELRLDLCVPCACIHHKSSVRHTLVGRRALITLKLFATVDQGPKSVHHQDLVELAPTDDELREAAAWVETQDASPIFPQLVQEAVAFVQRSR